MHKYKGFELKGYRTSASRCGFDAFSADIALLGHKVGRVVNDGNGGSTFFDWADKEAETLFSEVARTLHPDETFEVEDTLVWDLSMVFDINRKRSIPFLLGTDGDPMTTGMYRTCPARSRELAVAQIVKTYDNTVRVWDKEAADFLPVA